MRVSRAQYSEMFGPTVGDRVRLGDTDLWAEVEEDMLVYGDECVFGGGKTLRDGLGTNGTITAAERRARLRDHQRADRRRRARAS